MHYAKVLNGKVVKVIKAEAIFFDTFVDDSPGKWLQTSYNTHGNIHSLGGTPLRKNYAGIGFNYDHAGDYFYSDSPYPSWILDTASGLWDAPSAKPAGDYYWDEPTLAWIEIV